MEYAALGTMFVRYLNINNSLKFKFMFLKKLFLGVLAAFMVISCSNDDFADKEAANVQCEKCILRVKVKPFLVNEIASLNFLSLTLHS